MEKPPERKLAPMDQRDLPADQDRELVPADGALEAVDDYFIDGTQAEGERIIEFVPANLPPIPDYLKEPANRFRPH